MLKTFYNLAGLGHKKIGLLSAYGQTTDLNCRARRWGSGLQKRELLLNRQRHTPKSKMKYQSEWEGQLWT